LTADADAQVVVVASGPYRLQWRGWLVTAVANAERVPYRRDWTTVPRRSLPICSHETQLVSLLAAAAAAAPI